MSKDLRIRIFSFVLAAVLAFFGTAYSFTVIAFAANPASWEDVGEDAIKLRDAYAKILAEAGDGDFIGAAVKSGVDLPIAWLTTLKDGALAISPVDDLYYYFSDGKLVYDDNREHRSGGGGGRRHGEATEIQPEVPASFVKQVKDYWSDYYKPHENAQQFIFSYQSRGSTYPSPYALGSCCPVYMNTNGNWGGKNWDSFYFMLFYTDDSVGTYYSSQYFHVYTKREDGDVWLYVDSYNLSNGLFKETFSMNWEDIQTAPFLGVGINRGSIHNVFPFYCFASYADYLSLQSKSEVWYCQFDNMIDTKFNKSDVLLSNMLKSVSFTPDTNKNDDWGFLCSSEPFELFANQSGIDYDKLPDNYTITIQGDNIYNYPITDPSNGNSTTINNYITNNYIMGDDSGGGSGGDTTNNVWNIDFPDFIAYITTSIETAFTNVFVADVDVINNYNTELQDTFNQKLPFVNDFGDIFKSLFVDIVDNNFVYAGNIKPSYSSPGSGDDSPDPGGTTEASGSDSTVREEDIIYPKWTMDLTFFGKRMKLTILDFSMYAEPLSYVRLIVCVFIYAVYFVNLMKYLPTLIGGVLDMGSGVYSAVSPPRKGGDKS